ncbi:MAG: ATP-binding cassette domain-containing protein [Thermotaleaceae bacterium]
MKEILKIENLSKSFTFHHLNKRIQAIENISISLQKGEFIGITGRSGSGKSTILKCIYRTYLPEKGQIWYRSSQNDLLDIAQASERQIVALRKNEMGYVSQFLNIMPRTRAREYVEQAILEMGGESISRAQKAEKILSHFELAPDLWDSYPNTFSGGEKLRLNIARAMVKRPRLLLLDEPTASLDAGSKIKVRELIEQLKYEGTTMLGIFHDMDFMKGLCDKTYNMQAGEFVS